MNMFRDIFRQRNAGPGTARHAALAVSLALCLTGCIETVNFDVDRSGNRMVVDGMITDGPGPHRLNLRRTSGEEKITDPLTGAVVTITDNLGNREDFFETTPGLYELPADVVNGIPGRGYMVEISLMNGSRYRSEMEVMPVAAGRDSIYYEFDTVETTSSSGTVLESEVIRIVRNTVIPPTGEPLYLKWEVEETYKFSEFDFPDPFNNPPPSCYVTDYPAPQTIYLYDGSELTGGRLEPQSLVERQLDFTFYQRHYLNVIQFSVTRNAHRYWSQVDQIVNQSGTIFDVPPANATSNIYNVTDPEEVVLGYFHAAVVDTTRVFVTHADLPVFIANPCHTTLGPDCIGGCSKFDNSSTVPPFYWLQE